MGVQRKPGLHWIILQECGISTYGIDCECGSVTVPCVLPNGQTAVSWNLLNDRRDSNVGASDPRELGSSVCRQGLLQNVRDHPIIMAAGTDPERHHVKAEKWWLLSNAHAAGAVIQFDAKHFANIHVQATLAKGFGSCLVI